jgi:serine/threonine protein phosphatase PrpC
MHVQSVSLQGHRESNEDQHCVYLNIDTKKKNLNKINFYSVFDGHGGDKVSKFLKDNIPKYFLKKNKHNVFENNNITKKYIKKVFNHIQNKLKEEDYSEHSGSTALVVIHSKSKKKNNLWVANTGDSRGIVCNKYDIAIQLTMDHKPNNLRERKRIEDMNGKIHFDGHDWRVKDLSLSRAFGDLDAVPYVTHEPEIYKYKLSSKDKFMVLACDGLWDVLSNQEVVNFVLECCNYGYNKTKNEIELDIASRLAKFAINSGSQDNVTVIIQFLNYE